MTTGTTTWGQDTGTTTDNTRDFTGNWTGTGSISGSGDAEKIILHSGEYMESEVVQTATRKIVLRQNQFGAGDDVTIYYRTGATEVACLAADWALYVIPFVSGGYAQVRLEGSVSPLRASASGRYLVTANGVPFLMVGDSPQGIIPCLTPAQMETYMANREGYGINLLQVHLLAGATFGGNSTTFEAEDGTTPFTTEGDISTPREAFFAQVDAMLNLAKQHGIHVMLTAAEHLDAVGLFTDTDKCTGFGEYLGNRYKDFSNIIWDYGNDWPLGDAAYPYFQAVCDGIQATDPNHLHTAWLGMGYYSQQAASRDDADWNTRVTLDMAYSYYPPYDMVLDEYAKSPVKPVFYGEGNYENESLIGYESTPLIIRRQMYWVMLSGACGHFYCNEDIWKFVSGWATRLDSYPGLTHVTYLTALLTAYSWWLLVPDSAHTYLTAGYGTYADGTSGEINTNDYAAAAYIAGSLCMIYMPTNRTMSVDMSQFSGTVTCRWFDPTDGSYAADAASPHANSGSHDFSHAGANAASDADWVLVLEVV